MPKILSPGDIAEFRDALCKAATERFARHGYEGVTMRQLAEDLGCSPKTPYRYFDNKAEILATVRAAAFGRFADALERAIESEAGVLARSRKLGIAYVDFALARPDDYRLMFDLREPVELEHAELARESARARRFITQSSEELLAAGVIEGDARLTGYGMWAAIHGIVMLALAGLIRGDAPDVRALHRHVAGAILRGTQPAVAQAQRRKTE